MKIFSIGLLLAVLSFIGFAAAQNSRKDKSSTSSPARDEHDPKERHGHDGEADHVVHEHGKDEGREHDNDEAHGFDERRNVGPEKGVLEASENLGFKLREGVEERFGIKTQSLSSNTPAILPRDAIVYSKEEYQIFRKRNGFWKPVDVKPSRKGHLVLIESQQLKSGDRVATEGAGLLKIVELSVFGPAIEGHVH